MKISKRLERIGKYVESGSAFIDVGCDHALLSIFLVKTKSDVKGIASDINEGPLKKAKENIKKYKVEDKVKISLRDGITNIDSNIDTVIIAGMGYHTINKILTNGDLSHIKKIIISVNNDFIETKKLIKKIGFNIKTIEIVKDYNKYYLIVEATKENNKKYIIKNNDYKEYLEDLLIKKNNIYSSIPNKRLILKLKLIIEIKKIKRKLHNIK